MLRQLSEQEDRLEGNISLDGQAESVITEISLMEQVSILRTQCFCVIISQQHPFVRDIL